MANKYSSLIPGADEENKSKNRYSSLIPESPPTVPAIPPGPRTRQEKTLSVKPLRDVPEFTKAPSTKTLPQAEPKSFLQRMGELDPKGKFLPGNLDDTAVGQFLKRMNASQNEVRLGTLQEKPDAPLSLGADLIGGALGFIGGGPGNIGAASFNLGAKAVEKLPVLAKAPKLVGTAAGLAGGSVAYDASRGVLNGESVTAKDIGMAAAQNAALGLLPYGIGKGLELRANSKAIKEADKLIPELKSDPLKDVQEAYKTPSLRDVKQKELEEVFKDTPATERAGVKTNSPADYFGNTATQADLEKLFGGPVKKYSFTTGKQRMYEDIFNGKPVADNPAEYFGKVSREDLEKAWGKPLRRYSVTPRKEAEYKTLFSGDDAFFSPKREVAKANATPAMRFGEKPTQAELEGLFGKPVRSFKASNDVQNAVQEIEAQLDNIVGGIAEMLRVSDNAGEKNILQRVKGLGGIAPSRTGAFNAEYNESVPIWLRNINGRPLDEVADELGLSASELLAEMRNPVNKVRRKTSKDYLNEAYMYALNDSEYQALSQTLETLKQTTPKKKALGSKPKLKAREPRAIEDVAETTFTPPLIQPFTREADISGVRLEPRDLTNSRIGKAYPFELRPRNISETSKGNVQLGKTVIPGQEFQPRTSEGLQPERRTWTNRDNIPSAGPAPIRSITPETLSPKAQELIQFLNTEKLGNRARIEPKAVSPQGKPSSLIAKVAEPLPVNTNQGSRAFPEPIIEEGLKERGFSRNVRTDVNMKDEIRDSISQNPLTYEQLANKTTLERAQLRFEQGYERALADWDNSKGTFRSEDVPLARMLANEAVNRGDLQTSRRIIADISEKLTQAGQFSQAARILRQSNDPGAFMTFMQRQILRLNEQGQKQFGKKWTPVELTDEEMKLINGMGKADQAGREKIMEDVFDRIQGQIPVTKLEKFDSWRRMAMLLNPKTHIRNTVGNAIMSVARKMADSIGTALEKAAKIPEGERTKSVGWSRDKSLVETVNKEWAANKEDLMLNGRWDIESLNLKGFNRDKRIFDNKALNFLDNLSKDTLNLEDAVFMKRAYTDALGQYMSSNKLEIATEAARDYAKRRALEATFRQANLLSDTIQKLKNQGGLVGKAMDIAIPFSKTPANIVARAIDYSPAGLVKALYSRAKGKTATTVIEDLAKGMTGTGITTLGFMLANMGWARGERKSSKNAEGILNQLGEQPYSINTPLGNYTYDWAQPVSVPFAMGVAVHDALQKEKPSAAELAWDATTSGLDTIFNMSMLQSLTDLAGGGYGSISEGLMSLPSSYLSQAFPTLFGQIARTADDTKRSTYNPDPLKRLGNTFIAKTPFASKTLQPNLDVFGREQSQGGPVQQFINPGFQKDISTDPVTNEVARLYQSTKQTDFLPKVAPRKITQNKKEIILSPQQVSDFQRQMGQENYDDIQKLIYSRVYQKAADDERAKLLRKVVEDNYDQAKKQFVGK